MRKYCNMVTQIKVIGILQYKYDNESVIEVFKYRYSNI